MRRNWRKSDFVLVQKDTLTDEQKKHIKEQMEKPQPLKSDFEIVSREDYNRRPVTVKFKRITPDAELPIRGTFGSAGYDICANLNEDVLIQPNECVKIPTGFSTSFNKDFVALVYSRSGLATKNGLVVAQGTAVIDSDYRGEWFIPLFNQSNEPQLIRSGDRIAQVLIQPVYRIRAVEVDDIGKSRRGEGGFGSTGK